MAGAWIQKQRRARSINDDLPPSPWIYEVPMGLKSDSDCCSFDFNQPAIGCSLIDLSPLFHQLICIQTNCLYLLHQLPLESDLVCSSNQLDFDYQFGEVVEAVITKDRNIGRARGFGFVVLADSASAERVVMEKHVIDGRTLTIVGSVRSLLEKSSIIMPQQDSL